MNKDVIDDRIGSGEVHELEDAGAALPVLGALPRVQFAVLGEQDRLARIDIAYTVEIQCIQGHALRRHHHFRTVGTFAHAEHQRPDTVGVAECDHTETGDHGDRRVAATATSMHAGHCTENVVLIERQVAGFAQLMSKHVEQYLGIRICIDMPPIVTEQIALKIRRIGQVAIVCQTDSER